MGFQSLCQVQLFATPQTTACQSRLCPWTLPSKNTGVGFHFLLQETSLTQGLNLGLELCRQILYCLSYQVSRVALNKSWEDEQITSKCSVC